MFNGKIHYKWSFSIAMLNYQRVTVSINQQTFHHPISAITPSTMFPPQTAMLTANASDLNPLDYNDPNFFVGYSAEHAEHDRLDL